MVFCVGLTGGIGSGKSAAAERFSYHGITVVDADYIARCLLAPNTELTTAVIQRLGAAVCTPEGILDRRRLRTHVFDHPIDKAWLEALLHPAIRSELLQAVAAAKSSYCVAVIPLLIEHWPYPHIDRILLVDLQEELQKHRASQRDHQTVEEISAVMATQASRAARLEKADDVIDNSGDIENLHHQVDALHQQYLKMVS